MIIASFTTCIELIMQAYTYELYQIPKVSSSPSIVSQLCDSRTRWRLWLAVIPVLPSALDGFMNGARLHVNPSDIGCYARADRSRTLVLRHCNCSLVTWRFSGNGWYSKNYPMYCFAVLPPRAFIGFRVAYAGKTTLWREKKRLAVPKSTRTAQAYQKRVSGYRQSKLIFWYAKK